MKGAPKGQKAFTRARRGQAGLATMSPAESKGAKILALIRRNLEHQSHNAKHSTRRVWVSGTDQSFDGRDLTAATLNIKRRVRIPRVL
jgi:hypothetical protein